MPKILDHGFITLIDQMGNDRAICDAARVSTGGHEKLKTDEENEKLIRYLWRNDHTSPFEMVELKFHCKMPIFVARQWIRHRTASVNEMSGRYRVLPNEVYIPLRDRIEGKGKLNKQGSEGIISDEIKEKYLANLEKIAQETFYIYDMFVEDGIANEIARIGLPLNTYTEWYWKMDLRNIFHFLKLRLHPHAQYEIRVYAEAIAEFVKKVAPMAYRAFEDYTLNAVTFSAQEMSVLKEMITPLASDDPILEEWRRVHESEPGKSEIEDFKNKIGL